MYSVDKHQNLLAVEGLSKNLLRLPAIYLPKADDGNRTHNLTFTKRVLCQLSYVGAAGGWIIPSRETLLKAQFSVSATARILAKRLRLVNGLAVAFQGDCAVRRAFLR